ncbi:MAG: chemotaxis response regulator protein-glutamate methylesterase [Syntrophomonas sp.]|uniref:protein-glutamate methylesterase/protein-glutamine glutaminase n=1 Tax=Syntrophomonas sp. TaxID=2053627 RepID=UPI00260AFB8B|nr:chemotaxis response regulator protein-glutamate methylesterase [Syntrophomonas sp.]MDD2510044.1 chemotaxis response regulator protein-glutamate methylesterase [Syntrophomonas sp.]MDD3878618.1 chemotaxis response regulator protein-glutamate methylesterase [Syntrophomonas sp.]MDD4626079.1 chemotaxis response regulator protein-glutamate methylesterase [Syntrophomonas sp.]
MPKKRVLVVDDSAFMRKMIADIINSDDGLVVAGKAGNGLEALEKIKELQPDVVIMDVELPVLDGLSTLSRIMEFQPLPVIMFSSLTREGTEQTLKALQLGAVDFIPKPSGQISLNISSIKEELIKKLKMAANTKRKLQVYKSLPEPILKTEKSLPDQGGRLNKLLVIATSTGGPKALYQVIPRFPADLDAAILVVQHMPPGFTRSLAERLDSLSEMKVKEAEQGEKVLPGCVYIAPGDYHLKTRSRLKGMENELYIELDQSKPRGGLRPAADIMLESIAEQFWSNIVCVIMTGMGHDGAAALPYIKEKKGKIIAEHQSTCIVYGMPKAAVETGLVDKIVPLSEISEEVLRML